LLIFSGYRHLIVVESFQNAYKRADGIAPQDERDFTQYCLFTHQVRPIACGRDSL
jgi:hypothetical protein